MMDAGVGRRLDADDVQGWRSDPTSRPHGPVVEPRQIHLFGMHGPNGDHWVLPTDVGIKVACASVSIAGWPRICSFVGAGPNTEVCAPTPMAIHHALFIVRALSADRQARRGEHERDQWIFVRFAGGVTHKKPSARSQHLSRAARVRRDAHTVPPPTCATQSSDAKDVQAEDKGCRGGESDSGRSSFCVAVAGSNQASF